jgi:phosphatidylserine/phosphatidylglycerophosphate/cardiolipin synthase-like enzyme
MVKSNYFPPRLLLENAEGLITPLPGNCYLPTLRKIVGSAKASVDVIQYQWNFMPHEPTEPLQQFNQSVITQIRQGVKYRVLLNIENNAHKITRINQRTKEALSSVGASVKFGPRQIITHSKLFIVDDQFVILGSHNLSKYSTSQNDEVSVLITSRQVAAELKRYFDLLWARN